MRVLNAALTARGSRGVVSTERRMVPNAPRENPSKMKYTTVTGTATASANAEVHDVRAQHPRQHHLPAGDGQAHHRVVVFGRKEDGTALEQGKREDDDGGERHDERGQVFAQPLRAEPDGDHGGVEEDHRPDDGKRDDAAAVLRFSFASPEFFARLMPVSPIS